MVLLLWHGISIFVSIMWYCGVLKVCVALVMLAKLYLFILYLG